MDGVYLTIPFHWLLQPLDEDSALRDLEQSAIRNVPTKKRQFSTDEVQITGMKISPFQGAGTMLFRGTARNAGRTYSPLILFNDVVYGEASPSNVTFKATDGKDYNIQPIDPNKNTCQVRCNCLDFYYRFATWNFDDGSLYGKKPQPYVKTTERPPVNPAQAPGLCKHLMKMGDHLHQLKLLSA